MQCPACGTVNEAGRKFCHECGSKLAAACAVCGTSNPPQARFCGECGARLLSDEAAAAAARSPVAVPVGAPAGSQDAPVAERRFVTVLFADLVGFTTLAEGRDAEAVRELLSDYFELARTVIERYGGTVEKFIGDAVMAVWGAPVAREDDPERAVRAALELVDAVRGLGPEVQARAGVLSGEAAVTLGSRDQGMVAGDLVNTASRLQSVAAPGTVLVGEATHRAAASAITFEDAGETVLKGKEAPVAAWRALRVVAERHGRGRSDRLEAPFVGRDAELRLMKDLFHATSREHRARLVSITGQAGIGKSRLTWELEKYLDGLVEGVWWHDGRSPAYGEGITFWALGEMVRARCGLIETDDPDTTRDKVVATLAEHVPDEAERRWIEPAVLALLGVGESPAGGRDELFRAWRTFFERLAATGIVVLAFEDLHWADAGLLDFIDHMLEWSRGVPILIITLARPDLLTRRPDWGAGRRNFLALGLEPLDEASMLELLAGLVPGLATTTARSIVARADGIPLYAVETVRMLVADGRLKEVDGGRYEPVGELGELAVPETLQALIAARLDGLPAADRAILQDAAVLGQSFTLAGLSAVTGQTPEALDPRLRVLVDMELLDQKVDPRSPERGQYAFVQALIREVAYTTLAKRDRRSRHLAAARFFESLGEDELAGALAAHYVAAYEAVPDGPEGDALAVQARLALVGAADRATALGSPEQAISFLTQAKDVKAEPAERATILERLGRAATAAGRPDLAEPPLTEAIEIRRSLSDEKAAYRATKWLAQGLLSGRLTERASAVLEPAVSKGPGVADEADLAELIAILARVRSLEQRYFEALALADRALEIAEPMELFEVIADALGTKGNILTQHGRAIEGVSLLETARRVAQEHGLTAMEARAITGLSISLATRDVRATWDLEVEGIEFARRTGRRDFEMTIIGNGGEDAIRLGEWDWHASQVAHFEDIELTALQRVALGFPASVIATLRGTAGADAEIERFRAAIAEIGDTDYAMTESDLDAWIAMLDSRFAASRDEWFKQAELSDTNAPFALPRAARASLLARDASGAREAIARLDAIGVRGQVLEIERQAIGAGIDGLDGRTKDSIAGFRAAMAAWREGGVLWDEAWTAWCALAVLGTDHPEVVTMGREGRGILVKLGANAVVAHFDKLLGDAADADDDGVDSDATPAATRDAEVAEPA